MCSMIHYIVVGSVTIVTWLPWKRHFCLVGNTNSLHLDSFQLVVIVSFIFPFGHFQHCCFFIKDGDRIFKKKMQERKLQYIKLIPELKSNFGLLYVKKSTFLAKHAELF